MSDTEKFLSEYKRFESALRETGDADSVLDFENDIMSMSMDDYDKIKTCRIIRNYIQHHPDGKKMFPASTEMIKYIGGLADKEEAKLKHVKDIMKRSKPISFDTTIKDAITALEKAKTGILAVTDKDGNYVGYLSNAAVIWMISQNLSLAGKVGKYIDEAWLKKYMKGQEALIVSPDDKAEIIYEDNSHKIFAACKDGKYKGFFVKE